MRWWGALGLVALDQRAEPALTALHMAAGDDSADVRVVAAEHPNIVARLTQIMKEQHTPSKEFPSAALDK